MTPFIKLRRQRVKALGYIIVKTAFSAVTDDRHPDNILWQQRNYCNAIATFTKNWSDYWLFRLNIPWPHFLTTWIDQFYMVRHNVMITQPLLSKGHINQHTIYLYNYFEKNDRNAVWSATRIATTFSRKCPRQYDGADQLMWTHCNN